MNKVNFKKKAMCFATISLLTFANSVMAQETKATIQPLDDCAKELILSYFPENFVQNTLKKFKVPEDKWDAIKAGLAAKDRDILKIIEEKASKLANNPFKDRDPAQRQAAVKLFRETLFQSFEDVLKENGITDEKQIQDMLDDIRQQKIAGYKQCIEKHSSSQSASVPNAPSSNQNKDTNKSNDSDSDEDDDAEHNDAEKKHG